MYQIINNVKAIKNFGTYYCKKENIKVSVYERSITIIDLKNAMTRGAVCEVYTYNDYIEKADILSGKINILSFIDKKYFFDTKKGVEVYSPFVEVKKDKKVYKNVNKNNVVKMLLNGAIKKVKCNKYTSDYNYVSENQHYELNKKSFMELAKDLLEDYHNTKIVQNKDCITVYVHSCLDYELYI